MVLDTTQRSRHSLIKRILFVFTETPEEISASKAHYLCTLEALVQYLIPTKMGN
jgi:hypothetical protein